MNFNIHLEDALAHQLEDVCEQLDLKKSKLVREGIVYVLGKYRQDNWHVFLDDLDELSQSDAEPLVLEPNRNPFDREYPL